MKLRICPNSRSQSDDLQGSRFQRQLLKHDFIFSVSAVAGRMTRRECSPSRCSPLIRAVYIAVEHPQRITNFRTQRFVSRDAEVAFLVTLNHFQMPYWFASQRRDADLGKTIEELVLPAFDFDWLKHIWRHRRHPPPQWSIAL
jgi:hypothetical protein